MITQEIPAICLQGPHRIVYSYFGRTSQELELLAPVLFRGVRWPMSLEVAVYAPAALPRPRNVIVGPPPYARGCTPRVTVTHHMGRRLFMS